MDLKRTWITMLAFLLVAIMVWVGFSVYFSMNDSTLNPNASSYTESISGKFDTEMLKEITDRVETLPVKPEAFTVLIEN